MTYEMALRCMEIVMQFYGAMDVRVVSRLLYVDDVLLNTDAVGEEYLNELRNFDKNRYAARVLIHIGDEGLSWMLFGKFKDDTISVARYYRYCCGIGKWEYFRWVVCKHRELEWVKGEDREGKDAVSVFSEMMLLCNGYVYNMDESNFDAYKSAVHRLNLLIGEE